MKINDKWKNFINIFKEKVATKLEPFLYDQIRSCITFDVRENQERYENKSRLEISDDFLRWRCSEETKTGMLEQDLIDEIPSYYALHLNPRIIRQAKHLSFSGFRFFIYSNAENLDAMSAIKQFRTNRLCRSCQR
jgi:hypothetical protein